MTRRTSFEFQDDDHEALARAGKALLTAKGKDATLKLLKASPGSPPGCHPRRWAPCGSSQASLTCLWPPAGCWGAAGRGCTELRECQERSPRPGQGRGAQRFPEPQGQGADGRRRRRRRRRVLRRRRPTAGELQTGSSDHPLLNALLLQEVRLYTALCLCHILRLHAPETPYTDAELQVGAAGALPHYHSQLLPAAGGPHPIRTHLFCIRPCCCCCCCCRASSSC